MSYWIRCRKDKIINSYILDRHTDPNNPVMKVTQDDKIPIYDSKADAEADIANIEEGAIVATKDTGATEKVVDVVEDGNMNPVTSNAVAQLGTVDVSSGNTFRFITGRLLAMWYDTNTIYLHIPFPFVTKNTDYSIAFNRIHLDDVGDVQNVSSAASKYNNGCDILINNNSRGTRFATTVDITITF